MTYENEDHLNMLIKALKVDTNKISDGYHTFGELYEHRIELFLCFCHMLVDAGSSSVWKSQKHADGTDIPGWFIMGIWTKASHQISYHIPMSHWNEVDCPDIGIAPEWDGHTSEDVVKRLAEWRKRGW